MVLAGTDAVRIKNKLCVENYFFLCIYFSLYSKPWIASFYIFTMRMYNNNNQKCFIHRINTEGNCYNKGDDKKKKQHGWSKVQFNYTNFSQTFIT